MPLLRHTVQSFTVLPVMLSLLTIMRDTSHSPRHTQSILMLMLGGKQKYLCG